MTAENEKPAQGNHQEAGSEPPHNPGGHEHDDAHRRQDGHDHHGHGYPHDDGVVILWTLNVQGVVIESRRPEITVRDAIKQAGFNPDAPWIIVLKIADAVKKEVDLSFVIDLRVKGIEKLRLTPKQINNGEMAAGRRVERADEPRPSALDQT